MKPVHKTFLTLLSFGLISLGPVTAQTPPPELSTYQIIHKNAEAMGGWQHWEGIESIRQKGTLQRGTISAEYVVVRKRPRQMRMTLTIPSQDELSPALQVIRGCDGQEAWSATRQVGQMATKQTPLDDQSTEEILEDASLLPILMRLSERDADFELIGPQPNAQGELCYQIAAKDPRTGKSFQLHISTETFLVERYDIITADKRITTVQQNAFIEVDDIRLPSETVILDATTGETRMHVANTEVGVGIYDEYFELRPPPESKVASTRK